MKTSGACEYYKTIEEKNVCLICEKSITYTSSSMMRHLRIKHPEAYNTIVKVKNKKSLTSPYFINIETNKCICKICGKITRNNNRSRHIKNVHKIITGKGNILKKLLENNK